MCASVVGVEIGAGRVPSLRGVVRLIGAETKVARSTTNINLEHDFFLL